MGSVLKIGSLFRSPRIARHPYKMDPRRDPNLENCPRVLASTLSSGASAISVEDSADQGTEGEILKGTLGVILGLYETIQGVYKGYIGY